MNTHNYMQGSAKISRVILPNHSLLSGCNYSFLYVWQTTFFVFLVLLFGLLAVGTGCDRERSSDAVGTSEADLNRNDLYEHESARQNINPDPAHYARVSLDYEGVYEGVVPAASGPGILTRLVLRPGDRFELLRRHLDRETEGSEFRGAFSWLEDGATIRLEGLADESSPDLFFVAENRLFQLDMHGRRIEGPLAEAYVLQKQAPLLVPWPLFEYRWVLREKQGQPLEKDTFHRGWPFLEFDLLHGRVGGVGGCNYFGGEFTLGEGRELHVSRVYSTLMACESLDTERYFLTRIEQAASWQMIQTEADNTAPDIRLCLADGEQEVLLCLEGKPLDSEAPE